MGAPCTTEILKNAFDTNRYKYGGTTDFTRRPGGTHKKNLLKGEPNSNTSELV
jgi:hypothetical protein